MPENEVTLDDLRAIDKKAEAYAKQVVLDMCLPDKVDLSKTIHTMGSKLQKIYDRHYMQVSNNGRSKKLSQKVAEALKCYWECCHESGETMRLQFEALGYKSLNSTQKQVSTAQGYADLEGWAYTLYNGLSKVNEERGLKEVLTLMALYWLSEADNLDDPIKRFDLIAEALDALELSNGSYMWDEGYKCKSEDISHQKSLAAKIAHRENYQLKSEAKNYWLANIDPNLSNDAAATKLMVIVPLTLRTLSSYVSEFKKEIQSASKA